jgi:four helix bundle protein
VKPNVVREKSFEFAIAIVQLYREMQQQREFVLSKQLLRSGTSIGANVEEACAAQSHNEFIAKMSIASKEARETHYWLRLYQASNLVNIDVTKEVNMAAEMIRLLTAIVKTAQTK